MLLHWSISPMEMIYKYLFWSTSLISGVSSSFLILVSIVSRNTPALFCLGCIKRILLALSLDFSVQYISYWRFPWCVTSLVLSLGCVYLHLRFFLA